MDESCAHDACKKLPDRRCTRCLEPFCAEHWERERSMRYRDEEREASYCHLCLLDADRAPMPAANQEIYYGMLFGRFRILGQAVERRPRCLNCTQPLFQTDMDDQLLCQHCGAMYARSDYLRMCRRPLWAEDPDRAR